MSLTAAARGFVVFLLSVSVICVTGQYDWGVTYTSTQICALKGSTIEIRCRYTYPSTINGLITIIYDKLWFTKGTDEDLRYDQKYWGRVQYHCDEIRNDCTLRITDLRESDSAEYIFRLSAPSLGYTGEPGVTLSVTDLQVQMDGSDDLVKITCNSRCRPARQPSFVWYKNGQKVQENALYYYPDIHPADSFYCAVKGHEDLPSPSVSAPSVPSVSVRPSGDIMEGSSVTLTCRSDANPAAKHTWHKKNGNPRPLSEKPRLVFRSIQSSDSGQYQCTAENKLMRTFTVLSIDVKYAPKLPSVSVSSSAEIVEGSSVTLTCSSDANPPAFYTWYKEKQILLRGPEGGLHFTSISSEESGIYYCKSENPYGQIISSSIFIHVQYAPKLPSVSVSPSAEIVEGSSVNLTCSSDANPAAKYTWYKENEDSPKASGQIFTITDIRAEHSGNYYCEAQNTRGRHNSTLHLTVVAGNSLMIMNIIRLTLVVLMLIPLLLLSLWTRKKQTLSTTTEPHEPVEIELESCPVYENVSDAAAQTEDRGAGRPGVKSSQMQLNQRRDSPDGNKVVHFIVFCIYWDWTYCTCYESKDGRNVVLFLSVCSFREMNTASFSVVILFTAVCISAGNGDFLNLQCVAENVGEIGQQSLLECVVKPTQGAADPTIRVVTWRKVGDERPLLVFHRGQTELQPGYKFAEPSWNVINLNVSLLITNTAVEHEGVYTCMVITDSSSNSDHTSLKVTASLSAPSVSVSPSAEIVEGGPVTLTCSSDANPAAAYTWYKENGNPDVYPLSEEPQLFFESIQSSDSGEYYCTADNKLGRKTSESIPIAVQYAPKLPSVSVSPSAEITDENSLTLTCRSDANPAANYTWYRKRRNPDLQSVSKEPQLVFSSIQSSDSGEYYCTAENRLGKKTSESIYVNGKYGPKLPSVSVSPSAEIVEGSSVTLTCSSDANPAANYTWYKENQKLLQGSEGSYNFTSISSEDRGIYFCKSENPYGQIMSLSLSVDVQYAPKLPSVSVSPSAEIVEGSSVTLTCSSDANPAANYTWYKENEDSPKASGQIFTISNVTAEHSGNYYCEAQNTRGCHNSTLHLTVVAGNSILNFIRLTLMVLTLTLLLLLSLCMSLTGSRKKKTLSFTTEPQKPVEIELKSCPAYENVSDAAAQTEDTEEQEDLV
ncbi:sialoadhesin-like [Epinephelus lanceolatus]